MEVTFSRTSTALDVVQGHDLRGKCVMITGGAGAGTGIETTRAMARTGARIIIAARDGERAEVAAETIRNESGNENIEVGVVDLASLTSVQSFTTAFTERRETIDILFCNAGTAYVVPQAFTPEGFELTFGTNYVGHFAMVMGLMPALRANGGARVVITSSFAHDELVWDDLDIRHQPYDNQVAYHRSKTALALLAVGLTKRYAKYGVFANAVHPGGIFPTAMNAHVDLDERIRRGWADASGKLNEAFKSPQQGAATQVWAALSPGLKDRGGLYLEDCSIGVPRNAGNTSSGYMPFALDPASSDRLWNLIERRLADLGFALDDNP